MLCMAGLYDAFRVSMPEASKQRVSSEKAASELSHNSLKSLASIFALGHPASGFQGCFTPSLTRGRNSPGFINMAAIAEGGKVLVVGGGPIALLAAKKAALDGYKVSFIAGPLKDQCKELLYGEGEGEMPNLNLLAVSGEDEFKKLIGDLDGIIMAIDGDQPVPESLFDTVMPSGSTVKRVVAMSRNLNGNGMGPTVTAAKNFGNKEIWDNSAKELYERFEMKLKSVCSDNGADYVICRAGTLKGGGPADANPDYKDIARIGLSKAFYKLGAQDIANWRMLFDCDMQGAELLAGDNADGPGFWAPQTATSFDKKAGDTGRHALAGVMVHALSNGAGNKDFAVIADEGKKPLTKAELDAKFAKLG